MSQVDPLLGSEWTMNEDVMNHSNNYLTSTTNGFNESEVKTRPHGNHYNTNKKQLNTSIMNGPKLSSTSMPMSESDSSSSDDIVIPMQRRKNKQRFTRKRRSRSSDSSVSLKHGSSIGSLFACPSACVKLVLTLLSIITIAFTFLFMAKLYDRIDSLQIAINDLSTSGNSVPQEMHQIHSRLKQLEMNSSSAALELIRVLNAINNITGDVKIMKINMTKIIDSVEAAPAIRQIPKELQDLQKVVAEMGSRVTTNDNEVKSIKESQRTQQLQADSMQSELLLLRLNVTELSSSSSSSTDANNNNNQSLANKSIESQLLWVNRTINSLSEKVDNLLNVYSQLQNWRTEADSKINATLTLAEHIHHKLHAQESNSEHQQHSDEATTLASVHNASNLSIN